MATDRVTGSVPATLPAAHLACCALREAAPDYVLLDGTLAECDRVGDSRRDRTTAA